MNSSRHYKYRQRSSRELRARKQRHALLAGIALFIITCALMPLLMIKPPLERIEEARTALKGASSEEVVAYAPREARQAQELWTQMMGLWQLENSRIVYLRRFDAVDSCAREVISAATHACSIATINHQQLAQRNKQLIDEATKLLRRFKKIYKPLPINNALQQKAVHAEIKLTQARLSTERGELNHAATLATDATTLIRQASEQAQQKLSNYLTALPQWKALSDKTIEWSRTNKRPAIIVDKFAAACRLYENGKLSKSFKAEFGPPWMGDKLQRGDRATPEGRYSVSTKKSGGQTIYYRALAINYPNAEDLARFKKAVKSGALPPGANPGGLIEIHGSGGKGAHWTEGCVALKNEDMRQLFERVSVGTPVTIVGSSDGRSGLEGLLEP
jgi:lipoprotein-anchoring transpeptidase ErfK/SrfK